MAQAPSLKTTPFMSLGGNYSFNDVFTKDFIHRKLGNFSFKAPTTKAGNVAVKLGLNTNVNDVDHSTKLSLSDEFKLGFPFSPKSGSDCYWETRLRRNGEVKFHVDGGNLQLWKNVNLFANVKTNMSLESLDTRLGVNYFGKSCESGTRLERTNRGQYLLTQRNILRHGSFLYGFVVRLGFDDFKPGKYDAILKYSRNSLDLYLRHFSPAKPAKAGGLPLGKVVVNAVYSKDKKNTVGSQFKWNNEKSKKTFVLGLVHKYCDDVTLKAKVSHYGKITSSAKAKLNDKLTVTVGTQVNLKNGTKAFDFKKLIPIPLGVSLDFAI